MSLRLRIALAFLILASLPATVVAQSVVFVPNPAFPDSNVHLQFVAPTGNCGQVATPTITRNGNAIQVNYVLTAPVGTVCIGTPPPGVPVDIALGTYPPGSYSVTATGFDQVFQATLPAVTGGFIVIAGSNVPTLSLLNAWWLALLAVIAGSLALHRRTAR